MNTVQKTNLSSIGPRVLAVVMIPIILLALSSTAEAGKPAGSGAKSADLGVQSSTDRRNYVVGQETAINVLAYSNDANPASSVKVTIALSDHLEVIQVGGGSVSCSGTSSIVCSIGNFTPFQRTDIPLLVRSTAAGWPVVTTSIESATTDPFLGNSNHYLSFTSFEATPLPLNLECQSNYVTCQIALNLPTTTTVRLGLQTQKEFYGDLRMAVAPYQQAGTSASFDAVGVSGTVTPADTTVTLPAGPYLMTISCCRGGVRTEPRWIPQVGDPNSRTCLPHVATLGSKCIPRGVGGSYVPGRSVRAGSGYFSGSATAS